MRKLVFVIFILLGVSVGALTALNDGAGLILVMMCIGAVVGAVVGGVLTNVGGRKRQTRGLGGVDGYQAVSEERDRNYWRDRGHPPFMKPSEALPDRHMFDPDRQE
jgi:hypothetical protein